MKIRLGDREKFGDLLDEIAEAELNVHFGLPGNISPQVITQGLARKTKTAHVTQIYLRCDWQWA